MAYMHIGNLYKDRRVSMFVSCFALEKLHGTSAHISWDGEKVSFFSGGEKHESFVKLFDVDNLTKVFREELPLEKSKITVYGEAYGGKCQKMSDVYGPNLRFCAFDVAFERTSGTQWLDVPRAETWVNKLGLEFVPYKRLSTNIEVLDAERDRESDQAIRNGMGPGKLREGIVLRPVHEVMTMDGARIIAKHKGEKFLERVNQPKVQATPEQANILDDAGDVAEEWVTEMRLSHVLDKLQVGGSVLELRDIPKIIAAMQEDVLREAKGEIVESKAVLRAIGNATALMFKKTLEKM